MDLLVKRARPIGIVNITLAQGEVAQSQEHFSRQVGSTAPHLPALLQLIVITHAGKRMWPYVRILMSVPSTHSTIHR